MQKNGNLLKCTENHLWNEFNAKKNWKNIRRSFRWWWVNLFRGGPIFGGVSGGPANRLAPPTVGIRFGDAQWPRKANTHLTRRPAHNARQIRTAAHHPWASFSAVISLTLAYWHRLPPASFRVPPCPWARTKQGAAKTDRPWPAVQRTTPGGLEAGRFAGFHCIPALVGLLSQAQTSVKTASRACQPVSIYLPTILSLFPLCVYICPLFRSNYIPPFLLYAISEDDKLWTDVPFFGQILKGI